MKKIRKGDSVVLLTGRDKGKQGTVTAVLENKLVIEGVNIYKKSVKPNPAAGVTGGMIDKTMSVHISNVAVVDGNGKPSRVGIKLVDGKKQRFLKTTGATLSA